MRVLCQFAQQQVFHQGFYRACQFNHKSYVINLDGLKNKSVSRIQYSFIDYNLSYDWYTKVFEVDNEDIVGDNAWRILSKNYDAK